MSARSTRGVGSWLAFALASQATWAGAQAARASEPHAGRVTVEIVGFEHERGPVRVALYRDARGFPGDPQRAFARHATQIRGGRAEVTFDHVPSGPFALLVHHDEDANGAMNKGLFGRPAEGYGVSRDAKATFGPPSFEDARLSLRPGEDKHVRIHMRY